MIDIMIVREASNPFEIHSVGLICGELDLSNALTKEKNNGTLDEFLATGKDNTNADSRIE